ncbi:DUF421 domain-containing protein [Pedobacter sp. GSP4]|uniref:DUF421 domain-containing protein n=1 Tax=Pedobacter sp. GSP4 TaxID=3453716 RepID=UPI003EED482C
MSLEELIGTPKDIGTLAICTRAAAIFLIAYVLIRLSGRRSFGQHSPLDNIIVILLGAILSRAIVGASPFFPVVAACILIVLLHRGLGYLVSISPGFGKLAEGEKIKLYENGKFIGRNLKKSLLSEEEVMHAMRAKLFTQNLATVDKIYMERNGEITIIKTRDTEK